MELVKKLEKYVDKDSKEEKSVYHYYLVYGDLCIQIKPSFKDDYRLMSALAKVTNNEK